jgi:hypothetical protein
MRILGGTLLLACALAGCGKQSQEAPAAAPVASQASAPPAAVVTPLQYPDVVKRAIASSDCSLEYYRSVNFNPSPNAAILDRGKSAELSADANSVNPEYAARSASLFSAGDAKNIVEANLTTLLMSGTFQQLSEEQRARSAALAAYYYALAAPAKCAVPQDVLHFVGKA